MTDNRTTELKTLSKLKMAGKLRYWRGVIEVQETELHAICDEIQAEHEQAIAATLGSGTCKKLPPHIEQTCIVRRGGIEMHFGYWRCSSCQCENFEGARFCMNCGAKVVDE